MDRRTYLTTVVSVAGVSTGSGVVAGQAAGDGRQPRELDGTFDDFEDIEPWRAYQDIGSVTDTTAAAATGSQSALLTPREEDGQVRVRRTLEEPIDVTAVAPGIAMAADRDTRVRIQLQDSDGHYVEFSRQCRPGMPFARENFGLTRVSGEPDLTDVRTLQLVSWFGDQGEGRLLVDDFYFVPRVETGTVLLQFHGGHESQYSEALPILEAADADIPATAFVPTGRIGESGSRLSLAQLETLSDAGWPIGSYGVRGTAFGGSGDRLESAVARPITWLEERGFDDGARFLAVPGSQYSADAYAVARQYYDLAFAGWGVAQGYPADPHRCTVVTNPSPTEAGDLLDWTAARGGFTAISFSNLADESDRDGFAAIVSTLDEMVADGQLTVGTPADLRTGARTLPSDPEGPLEALAGDAVAASSDGDDVLDEGASESEDSLEGADAAPSAEPIEPAGDEPIASGDDSAFVDRSSATREWDEISPTGRRNGDAE